MPDASNIIAHREPTDAEIIAELRADQADPNHPHVGCRPALSHRLDEQDYVRAYRMIDRSFRNGR